MLSRTTAKGLTFAVEPIKLALSESLEGLNK